MPAKNTNRLKKTAVGLAVIALLGFIYFTHAAINLFLLFGGDLLSDMPPADLTLLVVCLKPAIFLALIVSAAGLYRLRRWGLYLANAAMSAYLATFALTLFGNAAHKTGNGFNYTSPQWPVFLKYSYNWDTLILPASIVIFLVLLNFTRPFDHNV